MNYKLVDTVSIPRKNMTDIQIREHVKDLFGSEFDKYDVVYFVTDRNAPTPNNVVVEVWQKTAGYIHY